MKLRRITSLTAMLAFLLMLVTSVILYIVPEGRVAYWANWQLWGLSKEQWGDVHINCGVLFLLTIMLHIYYNWSPIKAYLKNKARKLTVFTPDFIVALVIATVFVAGTLAGVPPFSTLLEISASFKDEAAEVYGEPPYGHAELSSLATLASRMGMELEPALRRLEESGIAFTDQQQSVAEVAEANGVTPKQVYEVMKPEEEAQEGALPAGGEMPVTPRPGLGKRLLADLCQEYGLNIKTVLRDLRAAGIEAGEDQTMKEIGEANGRAPSDIYEAVRQSSLHP